MRKERSQLQLTARDLDVLEHLGDYRFLTHPQLAVLAFPSIDAAKRRMRELALAELALKVFVPVRPYDFKAEIVFALSRRGAALLHRERGFRPPHLPDHERRSGLFLDHTLRRNDVRLTLLELDRTVSGFRLGRWLQVRDDVRMHADVETHRGYRERITIVPDGVAELLVEGHPHVLAIEVDMGTVSLKRMHLKYRAYYENWRTGAPRLRYGPAAYRVLTLTSSKRRLDALRAAARDSPGRGRGSQLFWFGLLEDANPAAPARFLTDVFEVATAKPPILQKLFNTLNPQICNSEPSTASSSTSSASRALSSEGGQGSSSGTSAST